MSGSTRAFLQECLLTNRKTAEGTAACFHVSKPYLLYYDYQRKMGILQITHEAAGSASVGVDKHSTVKSIIEESSKSACYLSSPKSHYCLACTVEGQPGFASAHAVEADSAKGLELPGVASDYRLQQEVAGKRLLILASAIPQLKPNSEIFLVPAPQKKPAQSQQEAFPSPPASESPRLQSANTTALVKQENISPPAVPLGTGIRKLSHGKARTTEASRASSQASGSGSSAKVPTVTARGFSFICDVASWD